MNNPYDYTTRRGIRPVSWEDFHGICKALALAISHFQPDIIVAIGRGGYYPGTLIAHMLQVELYPVRLSRRINDIVKHQSPQWLVEPPQVIKGHRVVIVDEICGSGQTISMVRQKVEAIGASFIKSAVLYAHSQGVSIPDYIGLITDALMLNPWDREVLKEGVFQFHPEYVEALRHQGLKPESTLLIDAPTFELAKSE